MEHHLQGIADKLEDLTSGEFTTLSEALKGKIVLLPWTVPPLPLGEGVHPDGGQCGGGCPKGYICDTQTNQCVWNG